MFNYRFPVISNIDQVREAIAGRQEFIEVDKGSYIVFNYLVNFEDTFPPVINKSNEYDEFAAIRRECRGLIFDKVTGKVIARRYHKFFNYGEKPETFDADISNPDNYIVLEKLDGSMISFIENEDGTHFWATKMMSMDFHNMIEDFISNSPIDYVGFCKILTSIGKTPIFEWCSRKKRIVVDYENESLILTAIRDNITGQYEKIHNFSA